MQIIIVFTLPLFFNFFPCLPSDADKCYLANPGSQPAQLHSKFTIDYVNVGLEPGTAVCPSQALYCTMNHRALLNIKNMCFINLSRQSLVKGTVARDFWPLVFIMNRPHIGL